MNSPLKQYRHLLLIPALLCTLSLLLVTAIKVSATAVPQAVSVVSTYPSPLHNEARNTNLSTPRRDDSEPLSELFRLTIDGPSHTLLRDPVQLVASVNPLSGTLDSALFPVGYSWDPGDNSPVTIRFRSNGITSTGTITWTTAGYKTVNVTANTLFGAVTEPFTVAVSARSIAISSMQTATFAYTEFDGTGISVLVPAQTINGSIRLDYLPIPVSAAPTNTASIKQAFTLNALNDQQPPNNYRFERPATLAIVYDDTRLGPDNGASMQLRRWNGSEWSTMADDCGEQLYSREESSQNRIEAQVCQLGQFALFRATEAVFLPVVH